MAGSASQRRRGDFAYGTAGPAGRDGHPRGTRRGGQVRGQPRPGAGRRGRRAVRRLSEPRCGGLLPAGSAQPDRPDRRGVEQPPGPAGLGADDAVPAGQPAAGGRHPFTALHDAAGRVGARRGHPARRHLLLRPRAARRGEGPVLPGLDQDVAAPGRGVRGAQQGHRRRADPLHPRRGRFDRGGLSRGGPVGLPGAGARADRRGRRVPRAGGAAVDRVPRHPGAAEERAGAGPGLHQGDDARGRIGRCWCWPARRAGMPASNPRSRRCRPG